VEKFFAAVGIASLEPNCLSVLKFLRVFPKVCKQWFFQIIHKRKMLGTEDVDAKYVAGDFDLSLNSEMSHEISGVHGLPVFQFMAKKQAWENWRHCELSVKEIHLSWCFFRDVGKGFRIGKIRQQFKFNGTRPQNFYQSAASRPREISTIASVPAAGNTGPLIEEANSVPAVVSVSGSTASVTATFEPLGETSSAAGVDSTAGGAEQDEILKVHWLIINSPKTSGSLFYVAVSENEVNLQGKPSSKAKIWYAEIDYEDDPVTYRVDPNPDDSAFYFVKIENIICILPDAIGVPETQHDGASRSRLEVEGYVENVLEMRKRNSMISNSAQQESSTYAKKYATTGLNRRLRVPRLDKEDILLEGGTEGDKAVSALRTELERLPVAGDSDSASDDGGNL
jgi:hypothetical protein